MTTGYVALAVEGFQLCGTPIREEIRVLQSIESAVTGVQYCFYSLGGKDVQLQFNQWMDRFVRVREEYYIAENKKSSGKEQKKVES